MFARKLLAVALAATLLVGGVAATGAALPQAAQADDHADDHDDARDDEWRRGPAVNGSGNASDHPGANASENADGNASAARPDDAGERGPPVDMPDQVPEHVTQIHETIDEFLGGSIDHLGNALSDLLGGDDAGEGDAADNSTEPPEVTPDEAGSDGDAGAGDDVEDENADDGSNSQQSSGEETA